MDGHCLYQPYRDGDDLGMVWKLFLGLIGFTTSYTIPMGICNPETADLLRYLRLNSFQLIGKSTHTWSELATSPENAGTNYNYLITNCGSCRRLLPTLLCFPTLLDFADVSKQFSLDPRLPRIARSERSATGKVQSGFIQQLRNWWDISKSFKHNFTNIYIYINSITSTIRCSCLGDIWQEPHIIPSWWCTTVGHQRSHLDLDQAVWKTG